MIDDNLTLKPIAHIYSDVMTKFGAPRQSGLAPNLRGTIIFDKKFRDTNYIKGIEGFSNLWLIWGFSEVNDSHVSPTVRPPILGGNERVGVFATRSPFRPNPIGLTCVKLDRIEYDHKEGPVLIVSGIDMINGTPIYDIKPYVPYADIVDNATGGFTDTHSFNQLEVVLSLPSSKSLSTYLTDIQIEALIEILKNNPKPSYHSDSSRVYGINYAGLDIKFRFDGNKVIVFEFEELSVNNHQNTDNNDL